MQSSVKIKTKLKMIHSNKLQSEMDKPDKICSISLKNRLLNIKNAVIGKFTKDKKCK